MSFSDKYNKKLGTELKLTPEQEDLRDQALGTMFGNMADRMAQPANYDEKDPYGFKAAERIRDERDQEFLTQFDQLQKPTIQEIDPTVSLNVGDQYFDAVAGDVKMWNGDAWQSMSAFVNIEPQIEAWDHRVDQGVQVIPDMNNVITVTDNGVYENGTITISMADTNYDGMQDWIVEFDGGCLNGTGFTVIADDAETAYDRAMKTVELLND